MREGSAKSGDSEICGSRGKSQEVGSGPGSVACRAVGESFQLSGSQLLPKEQMWGDMEGESFTDGEVLRRGYRSEDPGTGDLEIFLGQLPCDVQGRICFKISKGQLEQTVKKFYLFPRHQESGERRHFAC